MSWWRKAVKALVDAGPKDDGRSLYASPVTATATGKTIGGVTLLRTQPKADGDNAAQWSADEDGGGTAGAIRWPGGELVIEEATAKAVKTLLAQHGVWLKPHPRRLDDLVPIDPTDGHAADVMEQYRQDCGHGEFPRFRLLRGIVDAPTLRADGTLLDKPGYDRRSGLYGAFDANGWPSIPAELSRKDARKALARLHEVVQESPFAAPEHRAVWVAGLLTIVGREYARGNVPLFAVSANNRGAGKGTLVDMATAIATGRPAAKWAPTAGRRIDAEAEEDKRLTTVALNGTRVLLIDNVRAGEPIGTPALDRAMTAGADGSMGVVSGRVLGESVEARAPWRVVVWATGNNLVTRGDLDRRVLLCRLHTDLERPENRRYAQMRPVDYCIEYRQELLTACLVILLTHKRALDAGEPDAEMPPWGSFQYWSQRIRAAVVWADPDGADPKKTSDEVHDQAHPEQKEAAAFFAAWYETFGSREVRTSDVHEVCRREEDSALAAAVADLDIALPKGRAVVNTRSLGAWLTAHFDRPGPYVLRQSKDRLRAWYVEPTEGAANARMPFYDDEYELPDGRVMTGTELFAEMSRLGAGWRLSCWTSPLLVDGEPQEVTFEQSAELHQAYDAVPKPAPGAKMYAILERGRTPPPSPIDKDTLPLPLPARCRLCDAELTDHDHEAGTCLSCRKAEERGITPPSPPPGRA